MNDSGAPGSSRALVARLREAATVLLDPLPEPGADDWVDASVLLERLVRSVRETLAPDRMWLLWTAISTVFPEPEELRHALRILELAPVDGATTWLLDVCLAKAQAQGRPEYGITIAADAVVVDVDFSARHNIHTGIQRVVRSTIPRWHRDHDIVLVAWAPSRGCLRTLIDEENARILAWSGGEDHRHDVIGDDDAPPWTLVVPWRSIVVLPEVPARDVCDRIAALGQFSGNHLVAIGYDCIPIVSADMVPLVEPNRFVRYLTVVKYLRRLAGISISATVEFGGFTRMLATQGLPGPDVIECALPVDAAADADVETVPSGESPLVLCVGSFEPRKNQLALLYAAEVLWRAGLRFRLLFVGGGGWGTEFPAMVRRLARAGRLVSTATAIDEAELRGAYREARFTVFTSVHEGYGLPAAESLSLGTPVVTTEYGSTREIGAAGGAVLVDPRDDLELVATMRELLTDDALIEKLRDEIRRRPTRTWDDYASQLWDRLIEPERSSA